ncbi:MAG: glutamine synthetase [Deltaproteobacteria bacterium]|nr:glutamine synthetase [Deltaproteobacteria bacterium]HCH61948.1 glutamine synthetase [Deltaproteobacteria bacterium]
MTILAQYIWIDGTAPSQELRGKTRVIKSGNGLLPSTEYADVADIPIEHFPEWGADGSSTNQAAGADSDIKLVPVRAVRDPFRTGGFLVLCEVFQGNGDVHETNHRARLRDALGKGAEAVEGWFGFEQEYTLMNRSDQPLGFPQNGYPGPQGPYYCAVGSNNITGRNFYEDFINATLDAGISVTGYNWEVMPGQAEVQVFGDALVAPDHLWLSRWLLHRTSESHNITVTLDPKPATGDWNGAGMHTNFSTKEMREDGGYDAIIAACEAIGKRIEEHLAVYGEGYERRLTGAHETASYSQFSYGAADRTASIRLPRQVADEGKGYLEDRRPNANACPYQVADRILRTVCGIAG